MLRPSTSRTSTPATAPITALKTINNNVGIGE
jgi:hypothetical protein